jgi:chromosome segregation ATPase
VVNDDVQVVSKDGTVINKSGIMTGGDPSYFDSKLKNWNASDQEKKKEEYKKNFEELQVCIFLLFRSPSSRCFLPWSLVRLTGSPLNTPRVCSLQACKKRVEQYSMDISNLHRQKTDVDHKLNVALKKKEDAEGYLKARTSEVEKLKKREQELLQKIAEVKKVLTQATCTFSLASFSHRRACANTLRSSITFFTAAAALAD